MNRQPVVKYAIAIALFLAMLIVMSNSILTDPHKYSPSLVPDRSGVASVLKPVHVASDAVNDADALLAGRSILARVKALDTTVSRTPVTGLISANSPSTTPDEKKSDVWLKRLGPEAKFSQDPRSQTLRHLQGDLKQLVSVSAPYQTARQKRDTAAMSLTLLQELRGLLRVENPIQEFKIIRIASDDLGMTHVRLQQVYQDVPLWGAEVAVHFNAELEPIQIMGLYAPTPSNVDLHEGIDRQAAFARARKALAIQQEPQDDAGSPQAVQKFYWNPGLQPILCWAVDLSPDLSMSKEVFVSVADGSIIHIYDKMRAGAEIGAGLDLAGNRREMPCWSDQGIYYAINTAVPMYNATLSKPPSVLKLKGAMYLLDFANQDPWKSFSMKDITSSNQNSWDPAAISVMWNLIQSENYYRSTFNFNSLDNSGMNIWGVIHWRWKSEAGGSTSENACWNPTVRCMQFGDGEFTTGGLMAYALDIVGHEYTHGVTNFAANLIYENQSGALDESLSDFFACMIDRDDWLIGEDIVRIPGKSTFRDLQNPKSSEVVFPCPSRMEEYVNKPVSDDHGGVHTNMGIVAHAGYLLAEGYNGGITREKAEQIFHRARAFYLTQRSEFVDFRRGCLAAARDLYGDNSQEKKTVEEVFDSVGIVETEEKRVSTPGIAATGEDAVLYLFSDEQAGWDEFHDGYYCNLFRHQAGRPDTLVTQRVVGNTLPAVSGDGKWILYVGQDHNVYWTDGQQEQAWTQNGIVRTMAMTKDKRILAYTTLSFDNKIYFVDVEKGTVTEAHLTVPVKDASPYDLKYADVLSFNFRGDYIFFDAVSEMRLANNQSILSWGIYGMRLTDQWVFMVKAQAADEQIGNPVMANSNDHRMTADRVVFEEGGGYHLEAVIIDFYEGLTSTWQTNLSRFSQSSLNGDDTKVYYRDVDKEQQKYVLYEGLLTVDQLRLASAPIPILSSTSEISHPLGYRIGEFIPQSPKIVSDTSIPFGLMQEKQILKRNITVKNQGNADLEILGTFFEGDHPDWFIHTAMNTVLAPEGQYTFSIICQPLAGGAFNTRLCIQSTDPSSLAFEIEMKGESKGSGVSTPTPTAPLSPTVTPTATASPSPIPTPPSSSPSVVYEFDQDTLPQCGWSVIPGGFSGKEAGEFLTVPLHNRMPSSQDQKGLAITVQPGQVAFAYAQTSINTAGNPLLLRLSLRADSPEAAVTLAALKGDMSQADGSIATHSQQGTNRFVDEEGMLVLLYEPDENLPLTPIIQVAAMGLSQPVTVWVDKLEATALESRLRYMGSVFNNNRNTTAITPNQTVYEFAQSTLIENGWQIIPGGFAGATPGEVIPVILPPNGFPSSKDQKGLSFRVQAGQVVFAYLDKGFECRGYPVLLRMTFRTDSPHVSVTLAALKNDLLHADGSAATVMPMTATHFVGQEQRLCLLYQPDQGETICPIIQTASTGADGSATVWVDRLEAIPLDPQANFVGSEFYSRLSSSTLPASITVSVPGMDLSAKPLQMVLVESGSFLMGSPESEIGRQLNEYLTYTEQINQSFYIGRFEITQTHWAAVMGTGLPDVPLDLNNKKNNPILHITWWDAVRFCNQLSRLQGYTPFYNETSGEANPLANGFRLPTESEWEYACRAGTTTRFYWGNDSDGTQSVTYARYGSNEETGVGYPRLANGWGLWDMNGNAMEWCQNWYAAPEQSYHGPLRSARGGSYLDPLEYCRSAARKGIDPNQRLPYMGMRIVKPVQ